MPLFGTFGLVVYLGFAPIQTFPTTNVSNQVVKARSQDQNNPGVTPAGQKSRFKGHRLTMESLGQSTTMKQLTFIPVKARFYRDPGSDQPF